MTPLSAFLRLRYGRGFRDRAAVEAHQRAGLAAFRRRVMPASPFYRDHTATPLADLPPMDKARMMEAFTEINTCGVTREQALDTALRAEESRDFAPLIGDVAVGLSTGTSGQRGLFLTAPAERRLWAAVMLGRFWPAPLISRQRVAFFLRANNALYESLGNALISFRFYDLLARFDAHLPALAAQNPTVLIAPAQILCLLARAQIAGELALAPRRVISVAEVLSPEDAALITAAFGAAPAQVYQCTEGVLGFTCRAGRLHLNERFIYFDREVIDPRTGAFCPVVSDFTRSSLPILRYRLDDVLIPDPDPDPCPCGCASTRLLRIEGRADDIVFWPGREGGRRMIASDALRQAVATLPVPVHDYRFVQQGRELTAWLETDSPETAEPALRAAVDALAARMDCSPPPLAIRFGLPPETDPKRRRVRVIAPPRRVPAGAACPLVVRA